MGYSKETGRIVPEIGRNLPNFSILIYQYDLSTYQSEVNEAARKKEASILEYLDRVISRAPDTFVTMVGKHAISANPHTHLDIR